MMSLLYHLLGDTIRFVMLSFFWVFGLYLIVLFCYYLFVGGPLIVYALITNAHEQTSFLMDKWAEYIFHPFVVYALIIIGVVFYMITDDKGWKETRSAWQDIREMFK